MACCMPWGNVAQQVSQSVGENGSQRRTLVIYQEWGEWLCISVVLLFGICFDIYGMLVLVGLLDGRETVHVEEVHRIVVVKPSGHFLLLLFRVLVYIDTLLSFDNIIVGNIPPGLLFSGIQKLNPILNPTCNQGPTGPRPVLSLIPHSLP